MRARCYSGEAQTRRSGGLDPGWDNFRDSHHARLGRMVGHKTEGGGSEGHCTGLDGSDSTAREDHSDDMESRA